MGRTPSAAAACAVLVLAACGPPDADPAGAGDRTSAAVVSGEDVNPVIDEDFPDPDVLEVDGVYYAFATNGNNDNVRVARSVELTEWEVLDDALPELPPWVIPGKTWAPEVTELEDGTFAMYFTATNYRPTLQCIGVAAADEPEGPYEVVGDSMLVCPEEEGGAIDAATFLDTDGTRYLLWKNDGNCCGLDTWLQIAPLSPDGRALAGPVTRLLKQDRTWEGHLVEAPTLVLRDGTYVLLYSANDYGGEAYAVGFATAPGATGPYVKSDEPLLTTAGSDGRYVGPGGQDVVAGPDGRDVLVFHSWYGQQTFRAMNVVPLSWAEGEPVVDEEAAGAGQRTTGAGRAPVLGPSQTGPSAVHRRGSRHMRRAERSGSQAW